MKTMQPIRNKETLKRIKEVLLQQNSKYYIMFAIGINTGLRVSDILTLKVTDIRGKSHVDIVEKKTKKHKRFLVNELLRQEIESYIASKDLSDDCYLIASRKGKNNPLSRFQAYRALNNTAKKLSLSDIGTHTMRKTFGYWHYKQYKDVAILQNIFNHSALSITLKYIGIDQDIIDRTMQDFFL